MKRITILLMLGMLTLNFANAQFPNDPYILLSNYTWSAKNGVIGTITTSDSVKSAGFKLAGENAGLFSIDKKNTLSIQKKYRRTSQQWYDLIIETAINGHPVRDTFRIVNNQFIRNKVIAHRGAWKNTNTSQNSISSLQHAIRLGCEGSEFDVYMSADSIVFINHDPHYQNILIDEAPSAQLAALKLSNGESLPTLDAYLEEGMKQNKTRLVLEIKANKLSKERLLALTTESVRLVKKHRAQAWIMYISFNYDALKRVKELDPYAQVAYLNGDKAPEEVAGDKFFGLDYNQKVFQNQPTWIEQAHKNNLTVNVWTVNDPALMDLFLQNKVDYITTDEPELLLEKVKSK